MCNVFVNRIGLRVILVVISILCTLYVFCNTPALNGTGLYFLLPLTFTLAMFIVPNYFEFQRNGFGLKIFGLIALLRYLFLPVLTCYSGSFVTSGISAYGISGISSSNGYTYGIIISCIELIVFSLAINYYYYKMLRKSLAKKDEYDALTPVGFTLILALMAFILIRGRIWNSTRFLIVNSYLDAESIYGSDNYLMHALMGYLVVVITSVFQKKYQKNNSALNLVFPILIGLLTCTLVVGNTRNYILFFGISALSVLQSSFPKYRKFLSFSFFSVTAIVLISFTLLKQFGVESGAISNIEQDDANAGLSAYICGIENIAHTYDLYAKTGDQVELITPLSDIINHTPVLKLIPNSSLLEYFKNIPTTTDLATVHSEMVSISGQSIFLGGYYLGWLIDVLACFVLGKLLVVSECRSKCGNSIGYKYIYTWLSVLFGMSMCYCLQTIYQNVMYVPFFVLCLMKMNNILKIKRYEN